MPNEREINLSIEYAERWRCQVLAVIERHETSIAQNQRLLAAIDERLETDRKRLAALQRLEVRLAGG